VGLFSFALEKKARQSPPAYKAFLLVAGILTNPECRQPVDVSEIPKPPGSSSPSSKQRGRTKQGKADETGGWAGICGRAQTRRFLLEIVRARQPAEVGQRLIEIFAPRRPEAGQGKNRPAA